MMLTNKTILKSCYGAILFLFLMTAQVAAQAPSVTSFTRIGSSPTNSTTLSYYVDFSEDVTLLDETKFGAQPIGGGGTLTYDFNTTVNQLSSTRFQVSITNVDGVGTIGLNVLSGAVEDVDFNTNSFTQAPQFYDVDTVPPSTGFPAFTTPANFFGNNTNSTSLVFEATFNETIQQNPLNIELLLQIYPVVINSTGDVGNPTVILSYPTPNTVRVNIDSVSNFTNTPSNLGVTIPRQLIYDLAGNQLEEDLDSPEYTIDQQGPQVVSVSSLTKTGALDYELTATWDEDVSGLNANQVQISFGNPAFSIASRSLTRPILDNKSYTIRFTLTDAPVADTSVDITFPAVNIADSFGNAASANAASNGQRIDFLPPTATVEAVGGDVVVSNAFLNWDINFSEPVTGFDLSDIQFTTNNGSTPNLQFFVGNASEYSVLASNVTDGTSASFTVPAGAVTDLSGNLSPALSSPTITYDFFSQFRIEVVSITLLDPNPYTGVDANFRFEVLFDDNAMDVDTNSITVIGTGAGGSSVVAERAAPGVENRWIVTAQGTSIGPGQQGTLGIRLEPGAVMSAFGGNSNQIAFSSDLYLIDEVAPTVVSNSAISRIPNTSDYQWSLEFNEAMNTPNPADVLVFRDGNSAYRNIRISRPSPEVITVTVEVEILDGAPQNLQFGFDGDKLTDIAGNLYSNAVLSSAFNIEQIPPYVTSLLVRSEPQPWTNLMDLGWNVAFSEPVIIDPSSFIINKTGTLVGGTPSVVGTGGTGYRLFLMGITGNGDISITVPASGITDLAGNGLVGGDLVFPGYEVDNTVPTLTIGSPNGTIVSDSEIVWSLDFSESVVGFDIADISTNVQGLNASAPILDTINFGLNYRVRLPVTGFGTASITVDGTGVGDLAQNRVGIVQGPTITRINPIIQVGSSSLNVTGASSAEQTGANSYTVGSGSVLDGVITFDTGVNVSGSALTGSGNVRVGSTTILNGGFSYNGTTKTLTASTFNSYPFLLGGVEIKPRRIQLRPQNVLIDGEFGPNGPQDLSFGGLVAPVSGGPYFETVRLVGEQNWTGGFDPNVVTIYLEGGTAQFNAGNITFNNPVIQKTYSNINSVSISSLVLSPNNSTGSGSLNISGFPSTFSDVDFSANGLGLGNVNFAVGSGGPTVTFGQLFFARTGTAISGGTFASGGSNVQMINPTYNANSIGMGQVIMPSTGFLGNGVITNVVISGISGDEGIYASNGSTLTLDGVDFILDETGEFTPTGFRADTAYLVNIGGFNISINGLHLTSSSFSAGGGFQVGGLAFNFALQDNDPGMRLTGLIDLPSNLTDASAAIDALFINDEVQINSLSFCTPRSKLKKSKWTIPQICFSYENGPPEIYEGSGSIEIPEVVSITAEAQVVGGALNRIYAELDDLNKPIGNTGAFLQKVGAGLTNLARLEVCQNVILDGQTTPTRVCGVPPIILLGALGISAGAELEFLDTYTFYIDANGEFYESGFDILGEPTVVSFPIGNGEVHGRYSGARKGVEFSGELGLDPISYYRGDLEGFIDPAGNLNATANAYTQIPTAVPVVGGKTVGGVNVTLQSPPYRFTGQITAQIPPSVCIGDFVDLEGSYTGSKGFFGSVVGAVTSVGNAVAGGVSDGVRRGSAVVVNGVTTFVEQISQGCTPSIDISISISIDQNGNPTFNTFKSSERLESWERELWAPVPLNTSHSSKANSKGDEYFVRYFTNYDSSQKFYRSEGFKSQKAAATRTITLQNSGNTIVVLRYENPTGNPEFTITTPSGRVLLPEVDFLENPIPDPTRVAAYVANPELQDATWIFGQTIAGDYIVEIRDEASLGNYSVEVLEANEKPLFEFTNAQINGSQLGLSWTDSDSDDDAQISIFLDSDNKGGNGFLLLNGISEDNETDMVSIDLATTPLPSGWYWPYVIIDDLRNAPTPVYADEPIFVPDTDSPAIVQNINVYASGPQAVVTWNAVTDPDLEYYKVLWTNEIDSTNYENVMTIQPEYTSVIVDGLDQNEDYRFTVTAVRGVIPSAPKRMSELKAVSSVANKLSQATKSVGRDQVRRDIAIELMSSELSANKSDLSNDRVVALADQAFQTAKANAFWNESDKKLLSFMTKQQSNFDKLSIEKNSVFEFTESPEVSSDVVVTLAPDGINNNPRFVEKPSVSVAGGLLYTWQAEAVDDDVIDTISFSKVSGPSELMVSPSGLVTYQTLVGIPELVDVTIAVEDNRGGQTELSWQIQVVPGVESDSSQIDIVSDPIVNAAPNSSYRYTPAVRVRSYNPPVWTLLEGPVGMAFGTDTDFGSLLWNVPAGQTEPERVRIRVEMDIAGTVSSDTQEWVILPEANDKVVVELISSVGVVGNQLQAIHSGVFFKNASNHEIRFSYRQLTPTEGSFINVGSVAYNEGETVSSINWTAPNDGEDYEIRAQLAYNGSLKGTPITSIWTAPEPVVAPEPVTSPGPSNNEPITHQVSPAPLTTLVFPMEEGVELTIQLHNVTSAGFITVSRFEDLDGAEAAGLNPVYLIGQRWVVSATGVSFSSATLTFDYEESLLNGIDETELDRGYRVNGSTVSQTFQPPLFETDTDANKIIVRNVTGFSTWYFGEIGDNTAPIAVYDAPLITSNSTPTLAGTVTDEEPSAGILRVEVNVTRDTSYAHIYSDNSMNPDIWTIDVTNPLPIDGEYVIAVKATDHKLNSSISGYVPGIILDTTSPDSATLSSTSVVNGGFTNAPVPMKLAYTDALTNVSGFDSTDSADLTITGSATAGASSTGPNIFTFDVTPLSEGIVTLQAKQGAGADLVGNPTPTSNLFSFTYDVTPPSLECEAAFFFIGGNSTSESTAFASLAFDEPVIGIDASQFSISGPATIANVTPSLVPGTSFLVELSLTGTGTVSLTFDAANVTDRAGNALTTSGQSINLSVLAPVSSGSLPDPATLYSNDISAGNEFGRDVNLDGSIAIVGAPKANLSGAAYIFEANEPSTFNQVAKLEDPAPSAGDNFGWSVDVDGNYAVVGAPFKDGASADTGAAYIFKRSQSGAWNYDSTITAQTPLRRARFGQDVAIDDKTIVVGEPFTNRGGRVTVYTVDECSGAWSLQQTIIPPVQTSRDEFGGSVAVAGDFIAIGSRRDDDGASDTGAVYIYERSGTTWSLYQKVVLTDRTTSDLFGESVSLSGGDSVPVLAAGIPGDDDNGNLTGSAMTYSLYPAGPAFGSKVYSPTPTYNEGFGQSIAISADNLLVGAPISSASGSYAGGIAYLFNNTGGIIEGTKGIDGGTGVFEYNSSHIAPVPDANDRFGNSVALDKGYGFIGAYGGNGPDDLSGQNTGLGLFIGTAAAE